MSFTARPLTPPTSHHASRANSIFVSQRMSADAAMSLIAAMKEGHARVDLHSPRASTCSSSSSSSSSVATAPQTPSPPSAGPSSAEPAALKPCGGEELTYAEVMRLAGPVVRKEKGEEAGKKGRRSLFACLRGRM
ncbi:hypothetical protein MMC32_002184 [Xylographa parallela]|nr:hypothetical protein [Xylographa parallela]